MNTSYNKTSLDYSDIIAAICYSKNPSIIVEFGILDGFSLTAFAMSAPNSNITAYDIFDDFNGNHANKNIIEKFSQYKNVTIQYGNFYEKLKTLKDESIDILHIDIANCGDVFEHAITFGIKKLIKNGIMLLEGGSEERDNVPWMKKYNKKSIVNYLKTLYLPNISVNVLKKYPSMTIITKLT